MGAAADEGRAGRARRSSALPVPGLHNLVQRVPPVVAVAEAGPAVFNLNWLSATGSGILVAALVAGLAMGYRPRELAARYAGTLKLVRFSLLTIAAMLAIGFTDALLGPRTRRSGWPSRGRAGSIRSSARCWAGWGWPSPGPTPRQTCCSAACSGSPPSSSASARS